MDIILNNLGKRFQYNWIFRNLSLHIPQNNSLAIIGNNGSGKSTLLKCISGILPYNEGDIIYKDNKSIIQPAEVYKQITSAAPYLELIEELTLDELFDFHQNFKSISISLEEFKNLTLLQSTKNKLIRDFSSGMKQRIKLGLAIYSNSNCLLLDEPTSNLDTQGIDWYLQAINGVLNTKTIIISSNMNYEYDFCNKEINLFDFK